MRVEQAPLPSALSLLTPQAGGVSRKGLSVGGARTEGRGSCRSLPSPLTACALTPSVAHTSSRRGEQQRVERWKGEDRGKRVTAGLYPHRSPHYSHPFCPQQFSRQRTRPAPRSSWLRVRIVPHATPRLPALPFHAPHSAFPGRDRTRADRLLQDGRSANSRSHPSGCGRAGKCDRPRRWRSRRRWWGR